MCATDKIKCKNDMGMRDYCPLCSYWTVQMVYDTLYVSQKVESHCPAKTDRPRTACAIAARKYYKRYGKKEN